MNEGRLLLREEMRGNNKTVTNIGILKHIVAYSFILFLEEDYLVGHFIRFIL